MDGDKYAHEIGNAHKDYDPAKVDAALAQIDADIASQGTKLGPPKCTSIHSNRPGVCTKCSVLGEDPLAVEPRIGRR